MSNFETSSETKSSYRLPMDNTLQNAIKLSITDDKAIMMDYWTDSLDNTVVIGVRDDNEKLLVKSADEYTSPISKIYKVKEDYIIVTENSIYLVSSSISSKKIS
jgi:hypothetical protein